MRVQAGDMLLEQPHCSCNETIGQEIGCLQEWPEVVVPQHLTFGFERHVGCSSVAHPSNREPEEGRR